MMYKIYDAKTLQPISDTVYHSEGSAQNAALELSKAMPGRMLIVGMV